MSVRKRKADRDAVALTKQFQLESVQRQAEETQRLAETVQVVMAAKALAEHIVKPFFAIGNETVKAMARECVRCELVGFLEVARFEGGLVLCDNQELTLMVANKTSPKATTSWGKSYVSSGGVAHANKSTHFLPEKKRFGRVQRLHVVSAQVRCQVHCRHFPGIANLFLTWFGC